MTRQVLFEEDGAFRVGTILAEAGASFQVEAAHGKRSKIKGNMVLLHFEGQPLGSFMAEAQKLAEPIEARFLWEVCGGEEFSFGELARDYFGRAPTPLESAAVALALHAHPMYFYRRGKGRYQAAPEENLKAALAGLEKKRRQQDQVDAWAGELGEARVPDALADKLDTLLFKPDKASFELFPGGTGFAPTAALAEPEGLPEASVAAFSIDDEETTEIDDAFSVERRGAEVRIGVHIAAPTLLFGRDHPLEALARERLSTVYFPGGKITMLPADAVERATLAAGRRVAAASLYLVIDATTLEVRSTESRLEWVAIADNLRLAELDQRLAEENVAAGRVEGAHGDDLLLLWRLARSLKALRGAGDDKPDRLDYTLRVSGDRVAIVPRKRGTPVDTLVSELMIAVNASWGKQLAERGYDAIYRNQRGAKTRMEVEPGTHEWLGVSHYAWASSPLRRFSDLANQRQLAAMLRGEEPAYSREELGAAARDFETTYDAYAEHQRLLERYWCVKYLLQEGIDSAEALVLRDELVRIESMPLVCRAVGLPPTPAGERVRVAFGEADLWEPGVFTRYAGK